MESYFDTIFTTYEPSADSFREVLQHVRTSVTKDFSDILLRPYSKEEIFDALRQIHPCKASGPDGMHTISYQRFCYIIGDEVFNFVSNILYNFSCPKNVNCTNIALFFKN